MSLKTKIARWLYKKRGSRLSEKQRAKVEKAIREDHLSRVGCDIKCPECREWFSVSSIMYQHKQVTMPDFGSHVECGKCGAESYWNFIAAPVPLHCDHQGTPILEVMPTSETYNVSA